ncbi:hypothetical protein [Polyangium mundeleinium]|uniref:TerB family tellurite resistance protein n=1 Tax=Polyangium mundeleinium TaxID=2995306 RepID=A0ABT5ET98_9BACT|nr:hypothetical protein [Polyangium mundeleinium]MDC0744569.1 hypothetical protein [Polyangium mundeleinium]
MTAHDEAPAALPFPLERSDEIGWADEFLLRLVSTTIRRYNEAADEAGPSAATGVTEAGRGKAIIRGGALFSALAGAGAGLVSTGGALFTAGTEGVGALVALPATALGAALDAALRLVTQTYTACRLAGCVGVRFDPDDPADVWALFKLVQGAEQAPEEQDRPGAALARLARTDLEGATQGLAARLFGGSLARSFVPFVGIVASSVTNYLGTRRLGQTVLRYVRYRAAFDRVLADERLSPVKDRLFEGLWFLFEADGWLRPEETALLFTFLRGCETDISIGLDERLADPIGWYLRLGDVPSPARGPFYHALEIGAAVDARASLRERELLARAAEALGVHFDEARLERMIHEMHESGMLSSELSADGLTQREERGRKAA